MNVTLSLALDSAGLIVAALTLLPVIGSRHLRTRLRPRMVRLFTAVILHLVALLFELLAALSVTDGSAYYTNPYALTAISLNAASVITLVLCGFSDEDGVVRFLKRRQPISLAFFASLAVPTLVALEMEWITSGVTFLGLSYSISLNLCSFFINRDMERQLEEREQQLTTRQARVMTRQMQPHFIFNSLASIEALCILDPEKAAACVENLAGYLRGNIDGMISDELIPFETELAHIRQYVALEQADPGRQFTVDYELGTVDFMLPALTVQPIVENAVKHGALSRTDGSGRVLLRTEELGSLIRVTVEDNGVAAVSLTEAQREGRGVGLENTQERLAVQCGGSLSIKSGENGARAVILIPKEARGRANPDR